MNKKIMFRALLLSLLLPNVAFSANLIERLTVRKNRLDVIINPEFKKKYLHDDFFIEYDEDIDLEQLDYSVVTLPFIMNVISLVWVSGKEYQIDSMDEEIFQSLERIKQVFKVMYPATDWRGSLVPKKLIKNKKINKDDSDLIALLFSGGLDSTSASLAHRHKQQLLITAWGQSQLPLTEPRLWKTVKNRLIDFAQRFGHKNAFIKSNYYAFLNLKKLTKLSPEIVTWRINTIEDISWAGLTAPILVTYRIPVLRIGSSDCWEFPYPTACNPYIDGNITFAGITIKHDQFDLSRFDKVFLITKLCKHHLICPQEFIICQQKDGTMNCSKCEKCLLTIISLLASGADPREYGFPHYEPVEKNMNAFLAKGKLSTSGIWQFLDIQKKIDILTVNLDHKDEQSDPSYLHYDLAWFKALDFNGYKAYDVKKATKKVDWSVLQKMFPSIKVSQTRNPLLVYARNEETIGKSPWTAH